MAVVEYYFWKSYYPGATLEDSGRNWSSTSNYIHRNTNQSGDYIFGISYFDISDIDVQNPESVDLDRVIVSIKNTHKLSKFSSTFIFFASIPN